MSDRCVDTRCLDSMHTAKFIYSLRRHGTLALSSSTCAGLPTFMPIAWYISQAIFEEMQAVGLHRPGGFMRQAFSLGDLTLLQPPNEVQGTMARTWSPRTSDAQAAQYSHSALPVLLSQPAHSPQQAL
jgi:hypothetical protein